MVKRLSLIFVSLFMLVGGYSPKHRFLVLSPVPKTVSQSLVPRLSYRGLKSAPSQMLMATSPLPLQPAQRP